jgi:hypothetical protein
MDLDDILYNHSVSKTFTDKHLTVKDEDVLKELFGEVDISVAPSDSEIESILKGNIMKMKSELSKIEEPNIKFKISEIAKTLDLPASKVKFIEEYTGINIMETE